MGSEKVKLVQDAASRHSHSRQLLRDLKALQYMLDHDMFESDVYRIGAEQEFCFVDQNWRPAPIISQMLELLPDPHFTTEFARFNMELNLDPISFSGGCLSELERTLSGYLQQAENAAQQLGAHVLLTGILPTIRFRDLTPDNLTPLPRYRALVELLHQLRGGLFEFRIDGPDTLVINDGLALFEGSNTSFQVHLQVSPRDFASLYNWSLAVTGPILSACTNSPLLLGRRLWRETRVALFQQSIDTRSSSELMRERSPRVCFGTGWVDKSVTELFKEDIARYQVMLASTREEDALAVLAEGKAPHLYGLNVHNGTVYRWNRPCYGITDGRPHLRIEMRALPAGPSIVDEIANAAFWLGLMRGMPPKYADIAHKLDFDYAKENFFKAARHGLGSYLWWISNGRPLRVPAPQLIREELLPIAREGLQKAGVFQDDIDRYLGIIAERVDTGQTGSQWQLSSFDGLKKTGGKDEALVATTAAMFYRQLSGEPVHRWALALLEEAGNWVNRYSTVEQVMSTDLFTVNESDAIDFAANLMDWRNIRHLPVEDERGQMVGLLTSKLLLRFYSQTEHHPVKATVGEVMLREVITVSPETTTLDALDLMREKEVACLPVVRNGNLVGLVTEHDFTKMACNMLRELS